MIMPRSGLSLRRNIRGDQNQFTCLMALGRGWEAFRQPVTLEPTVQTGPFLPNEDCPAPPIIDDGRFPSFVQRILAPQERTKTSVTLPGQVVRDIESPIRYTPPPASGIMELQIGLPQTTVVAPVVMERLLLNLANRSAPTAFEIIGTDSQIVVQIATRQSDAVNVEGQVRSHFPDCSVSRSENILSDLLRRDEHNLDRSLVIDFGLRRECLFPLQIAHSFDPDLLIGLISSLSNLNTDEGFVIQVLFQLTRERWAERFRDALIDSDGNPYFQESKELWLQSKQKFTGPLLAVTLRCCAIANSHERRLGIARGLAGTLEALGSPNGNALIALRSDGLPSSMQINSLTDRLSYRYGMLLNPSELAALAHLPSASVISPRLKRQQLNTKTAPDITVGHSLALGDNHHHGRVRSVTLSKQQRTRHAHLIGSSGSGKSTLMLNLIQQDLRNGDGLCVIDPHGDLIDAVIANVPNDRINDVILFDPSDAEHPIGFNILRANSEIEKNILSSDLTATFRRMSTSWGDVMDTVLANAVLAFLESSNGGTLLDLKRFLVEKDFRKSHLKTVTDESVVYFWENEFPLIAGKPQASILIRLDAFLRQRLVRNIVCQKDNKLDMRRMMDGGKVFLAKLSQGLIGEENAYLLGTMLVSRLYQSALSRQESNERPYFWLYLDEFHHFITPSMERILSGTRKYHLGLILAHQEFRQMQTRSQEVASSVLSNCYTRVCFRLGDADAERFAPGFSFFDSKALQNLGVGEAIARVERSDYDFNLKINQLEPIPADIAAERVNSIISGSRFRYARQRSEVEAELRAGREQIMNKMPAADRQSGPNNRYVSSQQREPAAAEKKRETISNEHRYLQNLVKRIGEDNGYIATIEKEVFGGIGKIDVALENENFRIACEIAVSNTTEYEVQNIQKCLSSGFDRMAVVSTDARHLKNIQKRAGLVLSPVHISRVHFLEPEHFHLFLDSIPTIKSSDNTELEKVKGYTVKTSVKETSESMANSKKNLIRDILSRVVRRRKRSEDE